MLITNNLSHEKSPVPSEKNFQDVINGRPVNLFTLTNKTITVTITNYGCRVVSIHAPDKNGNMIDVVVGPGSLGGFINSTEPYYGAIIGRYANRIAGARFPLNGHTYILAANNGPNHLHGGINGFHNVVWDAKQLNQSMLELSYTSADGEEGYPGNLSVKVMYSITCDDALRIDYSATTDKATLCNLTHHSFFNLNGCGSGNIYNHSLSIHADAYLPVDKTSIPLGITEPLAETPFDFREAKRIGKHIHNQFNQQIINGSGYDHCFILNRKNNRTLLKAAAVRGDRSGIIMEVFTNEPGMQFYSGNFMQGKNLMKDGSSDTYRTAFALETQHYPDSPNQPCFPSTILEYGEVYKSCTVYKFSVDQ